MVVKPLDLETIFVQYFAGSMEIFIGLTFVLVLYLSAKYRMPNSALIIMIAFYSMLLIGLKAPTGLAIALLICIFIGVGWLGAKLWKY